LSVNSLPSTSFVGQSLDCPGSGATRRSLRGQWPCPRPQEKTTSRRTRECRCISSADLWHIQYDKGARTNWLSLQKTWICLPSRKGPKIKLPAMLVVGSTNRSPGPILSTSLQQSNVSTFSYFGGGCPEKERLTLKPPPTRLIYCRPHNNMVMHTNKVIEHITSIHE
jgi:hypothetical protein